MFLFGEDELCDFKVEKKNYTKKYKKKQKNKRGGDNQALEILLHMQSLIDYIMMIKYVKVDL